MPIWKIYCECGGGSSSRLTYKCRQEDYGGLVPCEKCGELNETRPAIKAVTGVKEISISQIGKKFASPAELDKYCAENDCEVVSNSSKRWRDIKDSAKRGHLEQVQAEGYRDLADKRNKHKKQKVDRVRANQQKAIDKYHDKHGSSDKQTVEKAYGSIK